jgi:hypothetical protein
MLINDIILLKNSLKETKVGRMSNDALRAYLKISLEINKYANEFEEKRKQLVTESVANLGYDLNTITQEQDREIWNIVAPILDEYLGTEVELDTKVLSWDDLCTGILNMPENDKLSLDDKTKLTEMLCKDEL